MSPAILNMEKREAKPLCKKGKSGKVGENHKHMRE